MTINNIITALFSILIPIVLTIIVGAHIGVPKDPDGFKDRAEELRRLASSGDSLDGVLVREDHLAEIDSPSEDEGISYLFLINVIKWNLYLFGAIYFISLVLMRVRAREGLLIILIATPLFWYFIGINILVLILFTFILYLIIRYVFITTLGFAKR